MDPIARFSVLAALTCLLAPTHVAGKPTTIINKFGKPSVVQASGATTTWHAVPAEGPAAAAPSSSTPFSAANLPSTPDGTRVQFSRLPDEEAARALKKSKARNIRSAEAFIAEPDSNALSCGTEEFQKTEYSAHCRIAMRSPGEKTVSTCSAAKIGNNRLATAAHCIYDADDGGFSASIDVYCWGSSTCEGGRTTVATHGVITQRYLKTGNPNKLSKWDMAVLRTADPLPGKAFTLRQVTTASNIEVRMTGYPASMAATGCSNTEFDGCNQFSITDSLFTYQRGFYGSKMLTSCGGMSGSGVIDSKDALIAINVGQHEDKAGNCEEVASAPNLTSGFDPKTCEKETGGASLECLSSKLPA